MIMSGMRINSAARFVLQRQVHLVRSFASNDIPGEEGAVIGNHNGILTTMTHVHGYLLKMVAILPVDV